MRDDDWMVSIAGVPDGQVTRLGLGHAWVWKRTSGKDEVFDCGCTISHVLAGIAARLNVSTRDVDIAHA